MKRISHCLPIVCFVSACCLALRPVPHAHAKIDLVTLPGRDSVQLTIYNSADMTLARESRGLTLREGVNRLQFSWANTLIDPTSLLMQPQQDADRILIRELAFPPRVRNLGVWTIDSEISGRVPMSIQYLTSGITWRAFYMGTITPDERFMRLQGYVRVENRSGEDYENAQTRLIVGKVNLLDEIARLASREHPYGSPRPEIVPPAPARSRQEFSRMAFAEMAVAGAVMDEVAARPKEIRKEGLSEYFLYTIEGRETIPNGWGKRLPSFEVTDIPVVNLYKYEEERYGNRVVRFLSFTNDEAHELGDTPIPGGMLKVFRLADAAGALSYEGQSSFQYIPVGEDVELNLGAVGNVVVEPKLMREATDRYQFHNDGNISGWDEIRDIRIDVRNTRDVAIKVEIQRNFPTQHWSLERRSNEGLYEKVDLDTVKFTLELPPQSSRVVAYELTTRHGTRAD